jgi:pimeloyl-ACP methyl ester carboxylesterase
MNFITLANNRLLAYTEYGLSDGYPVFFFHGTPGSRLFCPSEEITTKSGVRLIAVDRPGYGGSTFQPNRHILDWTDDITKLADALCIDKFAIAGHSGGGPYTAACAYAFPGRVTAAAILSGAGPVDAPLDLQGMTTMYRIGFRFARYIPWLLGRLMIGLIYSQRYTNPARAMDLEIGRRPAADDALIAIPEIREICIRSDIEGFRQGLRGLAWDIRLITRPWGFRLEEISVSVYLWHGSEDNLTTLSMARYIAEKIPNCKPTYCTGEGHLLLIPHWKEILAQLLE